VHYALAYIRAARLYQVFVQSLLAADAAADPSTVGYLPQVTYDQANALCHRIQPNLMHAVAALNDTAFAPDGRLPLKLGPRIEAEGHACPIPHLEGIIAAARDAREWAAGLIAEYANAVEHVSGDVPAEVKTHFSDLNSRLAQADALLRFGTDLVGQISHGEATSELHEQAEDNLWEALNTFFLLNQAVAMPEALRPAEQMPPVPTRHRPRHAYRDRQIHPADLWRVAAPSARAELHGTQFGSSEMKEMCEKMGGVLSAGAQRYLDDVQATVTRGDVTMIAAMATCPFEPLYRARRELDLAGAHVPANCEFHWNFHRGHLESSPRFSRVKEWQECEG
jgi:hypothetical protein